MPTPLEGYSSDTTNLRIVRWREKIPQQQGGKMDDCQTRIYRQSPVKNQAINHK